MALVINTNMAAMNAARILDGTSRDQSTTMERLTSGLRINRAADDAAGMAVTIGMTTQIMGTEMAIRNANDGASLIQTVDGASEEVVGMLQRMRELSIQSMTGTYSNENRGQMDAEFQQLALEIRRVASTVKFNEIPLMNASASTVQLHVGWETESTNKIMISLVNFASLATLSQAISTASKASIAISVIDGNLASLKTEKAKWGALQNRLSYTVSNLANINENLNAARSRIQDADYAKETANLARVQVLQQAGMTMLGQSNQLSQNVLQLLQ